MSSLFGGNAASQNQNQPTGGGLFGSSTTQKQSTGGGGLFGSNTQNQQNQGSSLFGNNIAPNQSAPSGGLFGSSTTNQQNQGGGLFGGNTATQPQQQQQGGGLFGGSAAQNQQQGAGLFGAGATAQNQTAGTGLFGGSMSAQPANNTGTGLFGAAQPTNTSTSLFSNTTNQQQQSSLFNPQPQQQQQPQQQTPSLFQPSTFTRPQTTHPQQTHLSTLLQSGLGVSTAPNPLATLTQQDLARSRLQESGINSRPANEKSVLAQAQTLIRKWDPNSEDTLLQRYLYNAVNSAYAPFYYPNPDEREEGWEKALAEKPDPIVEDGISFVPVLVRGFHALGERVEYQAKTVNEMRARLHEMNNSLSAVMSRHQQSLSIRLENAKRQHAALSTRCLRLAVKAQILRQRNYPLDAAEESLRRTLRELEGGVFDPLFGAREEEIWARMVALRERGRWLEEEGKRVGAEVGRNQSEGGSDGGGVSEEVLGKTRRILRDYDRQIALLGRELEEMKGEFEEWVGSRGGR